MINNQKEYIDRYDAGQEAVNRGSFRLAYDCFMDCIGYLKRYEPWREDEIEHLQKLADDCKKMF